MHDIELKKPLSLLEQQHKLASNGICFTGYDDGAVRKILSRINYYRLTGYALQFRTAPNSSMCKPGTELKDVMSIYEFDAKLRNLLLRYIEPIEIQFRASVAYTFSIRHCSPPPHNQHLRESSYYRKHDASRIIEQFHTDEHYDGQPTFIKHHLRKYGGDAPLWVMVETMPFSRLARYYNCLIQSDKEAIADCFSTTPKNLYTSIQCIVRLRNKCAHGNRIYNTSNRWEARLVRTDFKKAVDSHSMFAYFLTTCMYLPTATLRVKFIEDFSRLLESTDTCIVRRDLMGMPDNALGLLRSLAH